MKTPRRDEFEALLILLKMRNALLAEIVVRQIADRLRTSLLQESPEPLDRSADTN